MQNEFENESVNCTVRKLTDQIFSFKEIENESQDFQTDNLEIQSIDDTDEGAILKMYSLNNNSYSIRNTGGLNSSRNIRELDSMNRSNKTLFNSSFNNNSSNDKITNNNKSIAKSKFIQYDQLLDEEVPDEGDIGKRVSTLGIQYKSISVRMGNPK